jgi:hypothetical protein
MSDPSLQIRNAQTIKFGMLAARSSHAIARAVSHEALSEEDRDILQKAENFLHEVAEGAAFITSGTQTCGSAFRSTEALGYALRPIESLDLIGSGEAPEIFEHLAAAVKQIAAGRASELEPEDVSNAQAFFERLYSSLLGLIEHNRLRPAWNGRRTIIGQYF